MKELQTVAIPAFKDNYIWLLRDDDSAKAVVVDPGDAEPVLTYLENSGLSLEAILITHHHHDHTGGIPQLKNAFGDDVIVYAPKNDAKNMSVYDKVVTEGDVVKTRFCQFSVMDIPGHTLGHVAYKGHNKIFCGDTLFSAGCGKVFEGTMEQMYHSLNKIYDLNDDIEIYCGHEYTKNNLLFAAEVEPNNFFVHKRYDEVVQLRADHKPTLPTTLGTEKVTNPFFRCTIDDVIKMVEKKSGTRMSDPVEIFSYLRRWKNEF